MMIIAILLFATILFLSWTLFTLVHNRMTLNTVEKINCILRIILMLIVTFMTLILAKTITLY
jgi:hypothetical protein|uniref:Uncharacterized protein n=1 Tax=Siphoviridae sp. ctrgt10 TaxID=2826479 RepID=A0A8S5M7B6_9CAUD|nr:MAG TPA: hypothetical protein [Siphoviridae sp. ctrgt10]